MQVKLREYCIMYHSTLGGADQGDPQQEVSSRSHTFLNLYCKIMEFTLKL